MGLVALLALLALLGLLALWLLALSTHGEALALAISLSVALPGRVQNENPKRWLAP